MKRSTILDTYLDSSDKSWKKFDRALNREGNNGARNKISNTFLPDRHYKFDANKIYETRGTILDTYLDKVLIDFGKNSIASFLNIFSLINFSKY